MLHFMTSITLLILMELVKSGDHLRLHNIDEVDLAEMTRIMYGYSYLLAVVVLLVFLMAAVTFLVGSRKRKKMPFDHEQCLK